MAKGDHNDTKASLNALLESDGHKNRRSVSGKKSEQTFVRGLRKHNNLRK